MTTPAIQPLNSRTIPGSDATPPPTPPPPIDPTRDPDRTRAAKRPATALISADNRQVRAGDHFVEIRVHRTFGLDRDAPFVWWTEAASARPGVDYVHQEKVTQSFARGKSSTSFFIKLLPNPSRKQSQVFYIAIAGAGWGSSSGTAAHAAIRLPTTAAPS